MKPHIKIKLRHYPGYGTPPSWEVRAIYDNHLLEEVMCHSEFQQGQVATKLKAKWGKEWDEQTFRRIVTSKPLASPWCSVCGGDTLNGGSSCLEKNFCSKCQHVIPKLIEEYRENEAKRQQEMEAKAEQQRLAHEREVDKTLQGAFQCQPNWYWKRMPNGTVRIMQLVQGVNSRYFSPDLKIPVNDWTRIIAALDSQMENGGNLGD